MKNYKKIMSVVFLASTLGFVGVVSAHTVDGRLGSANSGAAATDVYTVDCGLSAKKVYLQVTDTAPKNPSLVSVLAVKGKSASKLLADTKEGDVLPSAGLTFKPVTGASVYTLLVIKSQSTTKGIQGYSATMHCLDAKGNHTDTTEPELVQNN